MKKVFLILILNSGILFAQSASFDPSIQIESQLDTTSFKIGEKIEWGTFEDFMKIRSELVKKDPSLEYDLGMLRKKKISML